MNYKEYLKNLNWRYATKKFDATRKLTEEQVEFLKEVLRLSPSSFGLQPWKFYLIESKEIREILKEASFGQTQVTEASHLFVLTARTSVTKKDVDLYTHEIAKVRNKSKEELKGFGDMILGFAQSQGEESTKIWTAKQVYIALGMLLSACAQLNIDATPMEGFDKKKVDEILGLTDQGYASCVLCPVGFRTKDDGYANEVKVRFSVNDVVKEV